jgi:hypothetical protein
MILLRGPDLSMVLPPVPDAMFALLSTVTVSFEALPILESDDALEQLGFACTAWS